LPSSSFRCPGPSSSGPRPTSTPIPRNQNQTVYRAIP
jgi:hypothetical protein